MIALLILMASSLVTLERLKRVQGYTSALSQLIPGPGRGGGEDSHIKVTEMHLVSLRGSIADFVHRVYCLGDGKPLYLPIQVSTLHEKKCCDTDHTKIFFSG